MVLLETKVFWSSLATERVQQKPHSSASPPRTQALIWASAMVIQVKDMYLYPSKPKVVPNKNLL